MQRTERDICDFKLESLTDENEGDVKCLLHQPLCSTSKFGVDLESPLDVLREKEISKIVNLLRKDGFCKVLTHYDDVLGVIVAEKSIWDTEHFGFGVGKIKHMAVSDILGVRKALSARETLIKACLAWMKQSKVKCVMARLDLDNALDIAVYEQNGFQLADVLLTFHLKASSLNRSPDSQSRGLITIRSSQVEDEITLMEIARAAFKNDHFHRDFHFPKFKSDELFARWVYNCCHGLADMVLVATKENEETIGFITCKIEQLGQESKYGVIDLVAVSPQCQGKGVGTLLLREAVRWFAENAESIFVGTQANNMSSVRTYGKVGFKVVRTQLTFHKWFE